VERAVTRPEKARGIEGRRAALIGRDEELAKLHAALAAVIQGCAVNLSGDTGSLHLAMMTRAPAVAWFRTHKGEKEWIPHGDQYRVLIAEGGERDALHGISTPAVLEAVKEVL